MATDKTLSSFLLGISLFIVSASESFSFEAHFKSEKEIANWETEGGYKSFKGNDGVFALSGGDMFKLFSPKKLKIPPENSLLEFSLRTTEEHIPAYIRFYTENNETWKTSFFFRIPYKFNTYVVDLKEIRKSKSNIDFFSFSFAGVNEVEIDYINFKEPSFFDPVVTSIKNFMQVSDIKGSTINYIYSPSFGRASMMSVFYILFFIIFLCLVLIFWWSRKKLSFKLPFIISGIIIALLFVARMDYKWFFVWLNDTNRIEDAARAERVSLLKGASFGRLADKLKQIVPEGEKVKIIADEDLFRLRMRYFLLPLLVSDSGKYVLVDDRSTHYVSSKKVILRGGSVVEQGVEMLGVFENGTVLYKKTLGSK